MTLGELINKRRSELDESYEALASRAQKAGHHVTRTTLHALATAPLKEFPKPATLHGVAAALGVPVGEVAIAVLSSLGIDLSQNVTGRPDVRAWVTITGDRSDAQIAHLLNVAQTVAAALDDTAPEPGG